MNQSIKFLILSLCSLIWVSCAPAKFTEQDLSSQQSSSLEQLGDNDAEPLPQPELPPVAELPSQPVDEPPPPSLPPDLTTGVPDIDREAGPVLDRIAEADPEFDASDVYLYKLGILFNLIGKQVQKKYLAAENSCKLEANWKIFLLSFSKTRSLDENKCSGFQRAIQVAAANGGSCTPQIGLQKQFKLGNIIQFNRSTELDAECKCYRKYDVQVVNGVLINHQVRAFASNEVCAAEFTEYK